MSFFGFNASFPTATNEQHQEEDLAVYTWGAEDYSNLGQALQEGRDEFNDETFGSSEAVGMDFDFSDTVDLHAHQPQQSTQYTQQQNKPNHSISGNTGNKPANDLWESKSAASLLRFNSSQKVNQPHSRNGSIAAATSSSPVLSVRRVGSVSHGRPDGHPVKKSPVPSPALLNAQITPTDGHPIRPRTMAEIEAEMQAAAARQQHQQHSQHQSIDSAHQPPGIPSPRPVPREEHFQHQQQRSFPNGEALLEHMQQHMPLQPPINQYQHQHQRHPHPHPHPPQSQPAMELQALLDRNGRMRFPDPIAMPPPPPPPQYIDSQARVAVMGQQLAASRQDMLFQELMIQQHQQHQQMLQQQTDVPSMFHLAPEEKEVVVANAHRRIQEAELLEAKRRRKAAKISEYSRNNDLMTQSDKDFITRVQVAQLVTSDPYSDDFYAQVITSLRAQKKDNLLKLATGDGLALGPPGQRAPRRENAMQKMQAQVERLVSAAKNRENSKNAEAGNPALQNVLGKTSARSYKAAPRQMLAVNAPELVRSASHADKEAESLAKAHKAKGEGNAEPNTLKAPFTRAECLLTIERLFTKILAIEQLRRERPKAVDQAAIEGWSGKLKGLMTEIWDGLRVWGPLYETNPHPFICLITPLKGKRFIGRLGRDLSDEQKITVLSLIVAMVDQLDVVQSGPLLDSFVDSPQRRDAEAQFMAFQESVIHHGLMLSPESRTLKIYMSLLDLMTEDQAKFVKTVTTQSGLALLEHFFTEASTLAHATTPTGEPMATSDDLQTWGILYAKLSDILEPLWLSVFPSTRVLYAFPPDSPEYAEATKTTDAYDQHVWRFLAAFALEGNAEQHTKLVRELRGKIMSNLKMAARMGLDERERIRKVRNVNLFLNTLGLDSSQIPLQ